MVPYFETFTKVKNYQQMFWKRGAFKNSKNSNKGVNFSSIKYSKQYCEDFKQKFVALKQQYFPFKLSVLVQIKTSCEMQFKIQVRFYSFSVLRYSLPSRPYSEFFRSAFSRIPAYGVQMQKNMDQKNSEYGHFSRSVKSHFLACVIQRKIMEFFV